MAAWVPTGLAEVVHRALSRAPEERFQTMGELRQALSPFTGGAHGLELEDLSRLSDNVRALVAPRASAPGLPRRSEASSVGSATLPQPAIAPPPKRKVGVYYVAAAAAVGVAGMGAVLGTLYGGGAEPEGSSVAQPHSPASSGATTPGAATAQAAYRVKVMITPQSARVLVDGQERELDQGALELEAEPGGSFSVVVSDGTRELRRTVVVTREGKAEPARLELEGAGAAAGLTTGGARQPESSGKPAGQTTSKPATGRTPPAEDTAVSPVDKW
jgi:hypothetical protein